MITWRCILGIGLGSLLAAHRVQGASPLPPLLTTTAATTVDSGGRPWVYITLGQNQPGLIAGRRLMVYSKAGLPSSTNVFSPKGLVAGSSDPGVIQVQLNRAASIGDNLAALEAQAIALHRWLINSHNSLGVTSNQPPALPLNQRLGAILARAAGDQPLSQILDLYGLAHPALRLARGTAWAGPLDVSVGSPVTFEVREQDAAGQDLSVIGRVTILAGQPEILAIPGPLVVVPDSSASGDLNIKLRWATPDDLRHASSRHGGDVVWRISRSFAEAHGFDQNPPAGSALDQMSISNPSDAKRAGGPVFPSKWFAAADAADFAADATTTYVTDDNDRFSVNGAPFLEGSQYYYFVAAADALGRPGQASPGVLATVCRRVPPAVPARVGVAHNWDPVKGQTLDVHWQANSPGDAIGTTRYEVFRGDNLVQLAAAQRGELDLSVVPIVAGQPLAIQLLGSVNDPGLDPAPVLDFSDDGNGAIGKTWWYAIRAAHQGPPGCGDLFSPLSPPVFASLQDRTAPPAPGTNEIMPPDVGCLRIGCVKDAPPSDDVATNAYDSSGINFIFRCQRRPGVLAARFQVIDTADGSIVAPQVSVVFADDDDTVEFPLVAPFSTVGDTLDIQCAVEAIEGSVSPWAHAAVTAVASPAGHRTAVHFLGGAIEQSELAAAAPGDVLWTALLNTPAPPCNKDIHLTVSPMSGRILHPRFCIPLAPGTEQYRVYRRISDGPMTLIAQGLQKYSGPGCTLTVEDAAPPVSNGTVYYFLQLLDEQGRGSVMRRLAVLQFTGDTPPAPVLLAPQAADFGGTPAAPTLNLIWVCPPEHVERFEIFVTSAKLPNAPDQGLSAPAASAYRITPNNIGIPRIYKTLRLLDPHSLQSQTQRVENTLLTGRVGGDFAPGPRFTLPLKLDPSLKYSVFLRALGPHGEASKISRSIDFQWQAPPPPQADIAWPARPLPPVAAFNSGVQVVDFGNFTAQRLIWPVVENAGQRTVNPDETPIGIRIGALPYGGSSTPFFAEAGDPTPGPVLVANNTSSAFGNLDPNQQIYTKDGDRKQSLFPCVLYRQQVANAAFPQVSGDVIQCSPYLYSIAYDFSGDARQQRAELIDPFFRWVGPDFASPNPQVDLYLVDTQPVIAGAAYRYWLVRFKVGEPVQTVPCGTVTVQSP